MRQMMDDLMRQMIDVWFLFFVLHKKLVTVILFRVFLWKNLDLSGFILL